MHKNPSGAIHPTIFLLLWAVLSFGLQFLWPANIQKIAVFDVSGRIMMVLGGVLLVWAQMVFRRHGTTSDHNKVTTVLVIDGPFRFSRNPIYLALLMIIFGLALTYSNVWGLILVIPFVIVLHQFTILPEEDYLEREFGVDFNQYRSGVRRWI